MTGRSVENGRARARRPGIIYENSSPLRRALIFLRLRRCHAIPREIARAILDCSRLFINRLRSDRRFTAVDLSTLAAFLESASTLSPRRAESSRDKLQAADGERVYVACESPLYSPLTDKLASLAMQKRGDRLGRATELSMRTPTLSKTMH